MTSIAPESEVHSVEESHGYKNNDDEPIRDGDCKKEFDHPLQLLSSPMLEWKELGETIQQNQAKSTTRTIAEDLSSDDLGTSSSSNSKPEFTTTLGSQYSWSDDDFSVLDDHFGESVHESIAAIRKEASKIDAVLAVDQLDTLQSEVRSLNRSLKVGAIELEELQALVQLKDDRIGTLELERDLYKADTNKLASDLECCLVKLRQVGGSTTTMGDLFDTVDDSLVNYNIVDEKKSPEQILPKVLHTAKELTKTTRVNHRGVDRGRSTSNRLDPPSGAASLQTSHTSVTASISSRSVTVPRPTPVFEKPRISKISSMTQPSSRLATRSSRGRGSRTESGQRQNQPTECKPLEPRGFLQEQVQEISLRLMSSLETSEILRQRLAMLNRHYDNNISRLNGMINESKTDRVQLEFDYMRHISCLERKNRHLQAQLEMAVDEFDDQETSQS